MKAGVPTGWWSEPTKSGGGAWGVEELASRRYSSSMHRHDDKKGTKNEDAPRQDGPMKQPAAASSLSAWKSWVSGCPEGGSGCPGQRLDELLVASLEEVLVDS